MTLELRLPAGETEYGDPALVGEWAAVLPDMLAAEQVAPWCSHSVWRDGQLVGLGGFKGPPDQDGAVEIAYLTFATVEGQGIAAATAAILCDMARAEGITTVIAHTLAEENASNRVLKRNGFTFEGEVNDPEDGPVWRWRKAPGAKLAR